ncbi:hypothetical protein RhiTH_009580 [Rhizoctonia solani]
MPALSKKKCFHCGKKLSARACLEHQKLYLAEIAAATTSAAATLPSLDSDLNVEFEFEYESDNNSDSNADEDVDTNNSLLPLPSLENDINDLLAADPATLLAAITALANVDGLSTGVGLSGMIQETNKVVEGSIPALLPDGMSIEHPSTPPPTSPLPLVQGLLHNPPIVFEECLDFDFDFDLLSETGASDKDESMLATNLDCDPMFVEQDHPPTFDPINEPLLTDKEMLEILEMELGDLEDSNEWVDIYMPYLN